jgi:hypothetical protein
MSHKERIFNKTSSGRMGKSGSAVDMEGTQITAGKWCWKFRYSRQAICTINYGYQASEFDVGSCQRSVNESASPRRMSNQLKTKIDASVTQRVFIWHSRVIISIIQILAWHPRSMQSAASALDNRDKSHSQCRLHLDYDITVVMTWRQSIVFYFPGKIVSSRVSWFFIGD